jgi:putative FmdB family regulatory protein
MMPERFKMNVVCLECGKKFTVLSSGKDYTVLPDCPKCGGSDVELR